MKNSAKGDKNDIAGKLPQIEVFVDKTYQLLIKNNLEWIKVGDSSAGIADDIQYATKEEVHAYQMKWSVQNPAPTFSYNDFKILLPDLIESWKSIKSQNPNKKTKIYIITSQKASKGDRLKLNDGNIYSFEDYLLSYYKNFKEGKEIDENWSQFVKGELLILGISEVDFISFFKNFEFIFGAVRPKYNDNQNSLQIEQDYNKYKSFILDKYYEPKGSIIFYADHIKRELHLQSNTTFRHDFYVDYDIYTPNNDTITELNQSIESLNGGYIFLSGKPGTGKSTLLTEWIWDRNERIIRYYAYTNLDNAINIPERGNAQNLFFDLVLQIAECGFYNEQVYPYKGNIEQIISTFYKQLELLKNEFIKTGRKTIIIIDGLDHIPREYKIEQTLIKYLPLPKSIPDGVYFVLGSQTYSFQELDLSIKKLQENPERNIIIKPLTQKDIYLIIEKQTIQDEVVKEKIYQISEGHPLYLTYILKRIFISENITETLDQLERIEDINDYYERIWATHSNNHETIETLGLIVRLRFGFDERFLKEWGISRNNALLLNDFIKLFFNKSFDKWVIFHNSFKQFLLKKTSENIFNNQQDEDLVIEYHKKLENYSKETSISSFHFERLYHLFESKQFDSFIELAKPDYFSKQLESFRPYYFINDDLRMGLIIAAEKQNVSLLLRYAFLTAEFSRRAWNFKQESIFDFFPELVENEVIQQYTFIPNDETEVQILKLKIAKEYHKINKVSDSKLLFRMVQPIEITENGIILNHDKRNDFRGNTKSLIEEWVAIAHHFLPIIEIIEKIKNLKTETNNKEISEHEKNEDNSLKIDLIWKLLAELFDAKEYDKIIEFSKCFNYSIQENRALYINLLEEIITYFLEEIQQKLAAEVLSIILKYNEKNDCDSSQRIRIAFLIFKVLNDRSLIETWIKDIEIPRAKFEYSTAVSLHTELILYKVFVLKLSLGHLFSINETLPIVKNEEENVAIEFERLFFYLAQIRMDFETNKAFDIRNVFPIVRYFYQNHGIRHRTWNGVIDKKEATFKLLINIIGNYGSAAINVFWNFLKKEFELNNEYWKSNDLKLSILFHLFEFGLDKMETSKYLNVWGKESVEQESDLDSKITQSLKICRYWLLIEEKNEAKFWLKRATEESFGVGYRKDYQLQFWMMWLMKINEIEPEKAYQRIEWLNSINYHVDRTTENAGSDISDSILKELFKINLYDGVLLLKWQLENNLGSYVSSLSTFIEFSLKNITQAEFLLIFEIWGEIFIYTHNYSDADLLRKIINKAQEVLEHSVYEDFIQKLCYYLSVNPIIEFQKVYYRILDEFEIEYQTDFEIEEIKEEVRQKSNLKLTDDKEFTPNEVLETIKDFGDFWYLFSNQVIKYSIDFDWKPALIKFSYLFDDDKILQLYEFLQQKNHERDDLNIQFAKLCVENNFFRAGRTIIHKVLSNKSNTWIHQYDGAKRLFAYQYLIEIEGENARKEAFADYAQKTFRHSSQDLFEVDKILEVIAPNYQVTDVWSEMEVYLQRLFNTAEVIENLPKFSKGHKSIDYIGADLLLFYINQNSITLSQTSITLFIKLLSKGNKGFIERLKSYCAENTLINQINSSQILYCVGTSYPNLIKNFYNELLLLSDSKLFYVSITAQELLLEFEEYQEQIINRFQFDLNWKLYRNKLLLLNETFTNFNKKFKNQDILLEDVINRSELCIRFLADLLRLDEGIWENKIISIIQDLEQNVDFQNLISKTNNSLTVDSSSPILGGFATNIAINILLKELYEIGFYFQKENFVFITKNIDGDYWKIIPQKQPIFIKGIIHEGFELDYNKNHYYLKDDWYLQVGKQIPNYQFKFDDFVIIGETTTIRCLGWDLEQENRNAFISTKIRDKKNENIPFEITREVFLEDYYDLDLENQELILSNWHNFTHISPNKILNWLAFNPQVAKEMGWFFDETGLFRWTDDTGKIMVESIFWMNGNSFIKLPHFESEAGSGWYIKASLEGFEQLKSRFKLYHTTIFVRSQRDSDNRWYSHSEKIIKEVN